MTAPLEQSDPPAEPRRKKRYLRVGLCVAMLILVAVFVRFAWPRITLEPTPRPEYWEAEIAKLDPPPPGALSEAEAVKLLTNRPWEKQPPLTSFSDFHPSDLLEGSWDSTRPMFAAAEKVFTSEEFKAAHKRMREEASKGWYVPVHLTLGTPGVPYLEMRYWCFWFMDHARWTYEVRGEPQEAVEDWLTALAIARQLQRTSTLIDVLVNTACYSALGREWICQSYEDYPPIDSADLARRMDEILGPIQSPSRLLAGERNSLLNKIDAVYVRDGGDWLNVRAAAERHTTSLLAGRPRAQSPSRFWNLFSPLYYDSATAIAAVHRHFASLDSCVDIATCQRIIADNGGAVIAPLPGVLGGFPEEGWNPFPKADPNTSYVRGISHYYIGRCQLEAGVTMLALREYHRKNGRYPDRLDQLVPDFLPRLPIDYADRKPLRYRREGESYVLYSVGVNGIDDGGKAGDGSRGLFDESNPDAVFTDMRRRSAD